MHRAHKTIFDWDGTLVNENSALLLAEKVGRLPAALEIYAAAIGQAERIVDSAQPIAAQLVALDGALRAAMAAGAELLKGHSTAILTAMPYTYNPRTSGALTAAHNNGGVRVLTNTDWRLVAGFDEIICQLASPTKYHLAAGGGYDVIGSELEVVGGRFTGKLRRYIGVLEKARQADGSAVYIDSVFDSGLGWRTARLGGAVYVIEGGDPTNKLLMENFDKHGVPYTPL